MNARLTGIILLGLVGLYGCTSTPTAETSAASTGAATESTPATASGAQTGSTTAPKAGAVGKLGDLNDPNSPLYKKVTYFPFDSSEISAADRDVLVAHGKFLAANPKVKVTIDGHCDERGTREYNLALGERRAQAVQRVLMLQGATKDQAKTVSYGEERPAAQGHDESAWRLNRRAELVYSGQ
jgi:peptidoglycan-associated lipoprotein